ncbi:MAG: efflux RND transporter periplasmic adaptor subunit [Steroidobacteraceae bacterium]|nr:efflux RND transporter periplasmic adaptor subunit [Steroidobacteraceae bacterium]
MNSRIPRTLGSALLAATLAAGCGGDTPSPPPARTLPELETVPVIASDAPGERLFDGLVEALEQATLTAQTSGRIVAIEHDVDASVRRGELILRLSGVEQRAGRDAARQVLAEAEARATEAAASYERARNVYERQLVPRAELDRATAENEAARARLAAARAALSAAKEAFGYTEIRAPFAGRVTRRFVEVGESVSPGQPLAAMASPGRLRVSLDVPQAIAEDVRRLGEATVHLPAGTVSSRALTVFPAASAAAGTVRVWIDLPEGAAEIYPGVRVKAGFALGGTGALRIPASAVATRSEVTAVYVVADGGAVTLRQVRLGRRFGGEVEVLAGLRAGERIAADPVGATLALGSR